MDTNEIMANEEAMETAKDVVKMGSGKGFKIAAGIGLAILTGVVAYKYVVKPMLAKIKTEKEQQKYDEDVVPHFVIDVEESKES